MGSRRFLKVFGTFIYIVLMLGTGVFISNVTKDSSLIRNVTSSDVNSERLSRLRDECEVLRAQVRAGHLLERQYPLAALLQPPSLAMVRLDSRHNIAVCVPYKAGSESWRYLLGSLSSDQAESEREVAEERAGSWAEIAEFRRVIQVREPFERLLSAYRFTFQNKNRLRDNLQLNKKILQAYPNLPHEKDGQGEYASFPQFLQSIVTGLDDLAGSGVELTGSSGLLTSGAALHWLPYWVQCPPCSQEFTPDTLIHLDTWAGDVTRLLDTAGVTSNRTFYLLNSSPGGHSSDPELLRRYYSQVDRRVLEGVAELYHVDFTLFNFDKEKIFSILDSSNNTSDP